MKAFRDVGSLVLSGENVEENSGSNRRRSVLLRAVDSAVARLGLAKSFSNRARPIQPERLEDRRLFSAAPQVVDLALVDGAGAPNSGQSSNLYLKGRVLGASVGILPIEVDLNNDNIADGSTVTGLDGSFVVSLQSGILQAGPVTAQVRASTTDPITHGPLYGSWSSFSFQYVPTATTGGGVSLPGWLSGKTGFVGGSLEPAVGESDARQASGFHGESIVGGAYNYGARWMLLSGDSYETHTNNVSTDTPVIEYYDIGLGVINQVTTTSTTTTQHDLVATIDPSGTWTYSETWTRTVNVGFELRKTGAATGLNGGGGRNSTYQYTLTASGNATSSTYNWSDSEVSDYSLMWAGVGGTQSYMVDGAQQYTFTSSGSQSNSSANQQESWNYTASGYTNLDSLATASGQFLTQEGNYAANSWTHTAQMTRAPQSGSQVSQGTFNISKLKESYRTLLVSGNTSMQGSSGGITYDRTESLASVDHNTHDLSVTATGSFRIDATSNTSSLTVTTDALATRLAETTHTIHESKQDGSQSGVMVNSIVDNASHIVRTEEAGDEATGTTTRAVAGQSFSGTISGLQNVDVNWDVSDSVSANASDVSVPDATRGFTLSRTTEDDGSSQYYQKSDGTFEVSTSNQQKLLGTTVEKMWSAGVRTWDGDESAFSRTNAETNQSGLVHISALSMDSSSSDTGSSSYNSYSEGTAISVWQAGTNAVVTTLSGLSNHHAVSTGSAMTVLGSSGDDIVEDNSTPGIAISKAELMYSTASTNSTYTVTADGAATFSSPAGNTSHESVIRDETGTTHSVQETTTNESRSDQRSGVPTSNYTRSASIFEERVGTLTGSSTDITNTVNNITTWSSSTFLDITGTSNGSSSSDGDSTEEDIVNPLNTSRTVASSSIARTYDGTFNQTDWEESSGGTNLFSITTTNRESQHGFDSSFITSSRTQRTLHNATGPFVVDETSLVTESATGTGETLISSVSDSMTSGNGSFSQTSETSSESLDTGNSTYNSTVTTTTAGTDVSYNGLRWTIRDESATSTKNRQGTFQDRTQDYAYSSNSNGVSNGERSSLFTSTASGQDTWTEDYHSKSETQDDSTLDYHIDIGNEVTLKSNGQGNYSIQSRSEVNEIFGGSYSKSTSDSHQETESGTMTTTKRDSDAFTYIKDETKWNPPGLDDKEWHESLSESKVRETGSGSYSTFSKQTSSSTTNGASHSSNEAWASNTMTGTTVQNRAHLHSLDFIERDHMSGSLGSDSNTETVNQRAESDTTTNSTGTFTEDSGQSAKTVDGQLQWDSDSRHRRATGSSTGNSWSTGFIETTWGGTRNAVYSRSEWQKDETDDSATSSGNYTHEQWTSRLTTPQGTAETDIGHTKDESTISTQSITIHNHNGWEILDLNTNSRQSIIDDFGRRQQEGSDTTIDERDWEFRTEADGSHSAEDTRDYSVEGTFLRKEEAHKKVEKTANIKSGTATVGTTYDLAESYSKTEAPNGTRSTVQHSEVHSAYNAGSGASSNSSLATNTQSISIQGGTFDGFVESTQRMQRTDPKSSNVGGGETSRIERAHYKTESKGTSNYESLLDEEVSNAGTYRYWKEDSDKNGTEKYQQDSFEFHSDRVASFTPQDPNVSGNSYAEGSQNRLDKTDGTFTELSEVLSVQYFNGSSLNTLHTKETHTGTVTLSTGASGQSNSEKHISDPVHGILTNEAGNSHNSHTETLVGPYDRLLEITEHSSPTTPWSRITHDKSEQSGTYSVEDTEYNYGESENAGVKTSQTRILSDSASGPKVSNYDWTTTERSGVNPTVIGNSYESQNGFQGNYNLSNSKIITATVNVTTPTPDGSVEMNFQAVFNLTDNTYRSYIANQSTSLTLSASGAVYGGATSLSDDTTTNHIDDRSMTKTVKRISDHSSSSPGLDYTDHSESTNTTIKSYKRDNETKDHRTGGYTVLPNGELSDVTNEVTRVQDKIDEEQKVETKSKNKNNWTKTYDFGTESSEHEDTSNNVDIVSRKTTSSPGNAPVLTEKHTQSSDGTTKDKYQFSYHWSDSGGTRSESGLVNSNSTRSSNGTYEKTGDQISASLTSSSTMNKTGHWEQHLWSESYWADYTQDLTETETANDTQSSSQSGDQDPTFSKNYSYNHTVDNHATDNTTWYSSDKTSHIVDEKNSTGVQGNQHNFHWKHTEEYTSTITPTYGEGGSSSWNNNSEGDGSESLGITPGPGSWDTEWDILKMVKDELYNDHYDLWLKLAATLGSGGYVLPPLTIGEHAWNFYTTAADVGTGAIDGFMHTVNIFDRWLPWSDIGPVYGHDVAYNLGYFGGTVAGVYVMYQVGNVAAGTSGLAACGSLLQNAARLYTAADTMAGLAGSIQDVVTGNVGIGTALGFLPALSFGLNKLSGLPTSCFGAGTEVLIGTNDTANPFSSKKIEDIQIGDLVASRDENDPDAPLVLKRVTALYRHVETDLQDLTLTSGDGSLQSILVTDDHPFFVKDRGWVRAEDLLAGEEVVNENGDVIFVSANADDKRPDGITVYNLEVEDSHTFYVSGGFGTVDEFVWVHNSCSSNAAKLRGALEDVGEAVPSGSNWAAHIIPTGTWANRQVRTEVAKLQTMLSDAGLNINKAYNGFFSTRSDHFGTHTDKYIRELYNAISKANATGKTQAEKAFAIGEALENMKGRILRGEFLPPGTL